MHLIHQGNTTKIKNYIINKVNVKNLDKQFKYIIKEENKCSLKLFIPFSKNNLRKLQKRQLYREY